MRKDIQAIIQNDGPDGWRAFYPFEIGEGDALASPKIPPVPGSVARTVAFIYPNVETAHAIFSGTMDGNSYTRISPHPVVRELETLLLEMELAGMPKEKQEEYAANTFSSGMSPEFLLADCLLTRPGHDVVLSDPRIYGGTYKLFAERLPRKGFECHFVQNPDSPNSWRRAFEQFAGRVKFVFCESVTNPGCAIGPLHDISSLAKEHGAIRVMDVTVQTMEYFRPIVLDLADVTLHSLTKAVLGNSTGLIGGIIAKKELILEIQNENALMGAIPTPEIAWMTQLGLATLPKRASIFTRNLRFLAGALAFSPHVKAVHCPLLLSDRYHARFVRFNMIGVGPLIAFELIGGREHAIRFINALGDAQKQNICAPLHATHLGHSITLATYPKETTHIAVPTERQAACGIKAATIRMSVGIEPHFAEICANTVAIVKKTSS